VLLRKLLTTVGRNGPLQQCSGIFLLFKTLLFNFVNLCVNLLTREMSRVVKYLKWS